MKKGLRRISKVSIMVICAVLISIFAVFFVKVDLSAETEGIYEYNVSSSYATITAVNGTLSGHLTIPSTLGGKTVNQINYSVFKGQTGLTSVTIPDSVKYIGNSAFDGCTGLTSIVIPKNVREIGQFSFYGCTSLSSIKINTGCANIMSGAFYDTAYYNDESNWDGDLLYIDNCLIDVNTTATGYQEVRDGTRIIAGFAFQGCKNITEVYVPKSVNCIGSFAFSGCSSLNKITIPFVGAVRGQQYRFRDTQYFFNNHDDYFGYIFGYSISTKTYSSYTGHGYSESITSGGGYYQNYSYGVPDSLRTIVITDDTSVRQSAFNNLTKITSVTFSGDNSFDIKAKTFYNCTKLEKVILSENITSIGAEAFTGCTNLKEVYIPNGVTSIGEKAFYDCTSLGELVIPNSVTSIEKEAFKNCNGLRSISLPFIGKTPTSTGSAGVLGYIFGYTTTETSGTTLQYKSSSYSYYYYIPSSLQSVSITGNTEVKKNAFYNCKYLTDIILEDSVSAIGESAFYNCSNLKTVKIGKSIASIGTNAFYGCSALRGVYINDIGAWLGLDFTVNTDNPLFYAKKLYLNSELITDLTIPNGVAEIGAYAFYNCTSITNVFVPDSVTRISAGAFSECTDLSVVYFDGDAPSLGTSVFSISDSGKFVIYYDPAAQGFTTPVWNGYPCYPYSAVSDCSTLDENDMNAQGIKFTLNSSALTAIVGDGTVANNNCLYSGGGMGNVVIPETVIKDGKIYKVVGIGQCAFKNNRLVKTISIPSSVLTIGANAFAGCNNIEAYSVSVDNKAFASDEIGVLYNKSKTNLLYYPAANTAKEYIVADSVMTIREGAFSGVKNIESLTIPFVGGIAKTDSDTYQYPFGYIFGTSSYIDSVGITQTYRGSSTYSTTNTTYYIPRSLKKVNVTGGNILYGAFSGCFGLKDITVGDGVTSMASNSFKGCSGLKTLTIPFVGTKKDGGNTYFGYLFGASGYSSNSTAYVPSSLTTVIVTGGISIKDNAFRNCPYIEEIILPDTVISIGGYAFADCTRLTNVDWGESDIGSIGDYAFQNCTKLESFVLPDSLGTIGAGAFKGCTCLKDIVVPENVIVIGSYAFQNCTSLETVVIGNKVDKINSYTFDGCTVLADVTLGSGISAVNTYAFSKCKALAHIELPDSVISIGTYAFAECFALEEVIFDNGLESIGDNAFLNCNKISNLELPDSLKTIGTAVFSGCSALKRVSFGKGLESIGNNAFLNCSAVESVYIKDLATWCAVSFKATTSTPLYYATDLYLNEELIVDLSIPEGVETISLCPFYNCKNIKSIQIPDSVTSIGSYAFKGCSNVESIVLPFVGARQNGTSNVHLGYIFGLTSYSSHSNLPSGLKTVVVTNTQTIGSRAFSGCTGITSITLPDNLTSINTYAFYGCSGLAEISIPDSVTSIGTNAFDSCTGLTTIKLGKGITKQTGLYFSQYTKLERIIVSDDNTVYCSDSTGVLYSKDMTTLYVYPQNRSWPYYNIPETTVKIESGAFRNCKNLYTVLVPKSVTTMTGSMVNCGNTTLYVYSNSAALTYAQNNSMNYEIVDNMTLVAIEVYAIPYAEEFYIGEKFDFSGLYVIAYYDVGIMQVTDYELIYDPTFEGVQTVTVKYQDQTATFDIVVKEKNIASIEIIKAANKNRFVEGTEFDYSGLQIKVIYEDGTDRIIDNYTVYSPAMNTIGTQTVTVSYKGFEAEYEIEVVKRTAVELVIERLPEKLQYVYGEELDLTGIIVSVYYDNGTNEEITDYHVFHSGLSTIGNCEIEIYAYGLSDWFSINIEKRAGQKATAPTISDVTDTMIILLAQVGCEYSIDGKNWQSSAVFNNLDPATSYEVYQRYVETETEKAGEASEATICVTKYTVSGYVNITGIFISNGKLTADISTVIPNDATLTYQWFRNGVAIEGATEKDYVLSDTDSGTQISVVVTAYGSYYGELRSKAVVAAPSRPIIKEYTCDSVTLISTEGYEYSNDGGVTWQKSSLFEGLSPYEHYQFCQRVAESTENYASANSGTIEFIVPEETHDYDNACDTSCNTCDFVRSIEHNFSAEWTTDSEGHWHECVICKSRDQEGQHGAAEGNEATCTEDQVCAVCDKVLVGAFGHTSGSEATCTEDQYCTVCREVLVEAFGHTPGDLATCTEPQVCTVCGDIIKKALGHTPGDPATCTKPQVCTVCGDVLAEALGHTPGDPATCTEDQICTVCRDVLKEALGHTSGDPATCTEDQVCTVCGDVLAEALGHTPGDPATCTEDQVCTVCGDVLKEALGHTPGDPATCAEDQTCTVCGDVLVEAHHTPGSPATCTEPQVCTICGEVLTEAPGHTLGPDATCTENQVCTVCGEVLAEAHHTPGSPATCTEDQVCTVCGDMLEEALGHTPGADATCTEDQVCTVCGQVLVEAHHTSGPDATCTDDQVCTVCGEILVAAPGHTPGPDATCTRHQKCTVCGAELAITLGHEFIDEYCTRCGQYEHCGDIDGDGVITAMDSNLLERAIVGSLKIEEATDEFLAADVNGDGQINSIDSNLLKRMIAGAI